jgi:hypothetical protein
MFKTMTADGLPVKYFFNMFNNRSSHVARQRPGARCRAAGACSAAPVGWPGAAPQ